MITSQLSIALAILYPEVNHIIGDDAFDANNNLVLYDLQAVEKKAKELQAAAESEQEAATAAKQTGIAKLAKLGLTQDEVKALVG